MKARSVNIMVVLLALLGIVVQLSLVGLTVYIVLHFVTKYW